MGTFLSTKYLTHLLNDLVQNFTCEIMVCETCISHMNWNINKINFAYKIFIPQVELNQFTYVILFSYMKLNVKIL